MSEDSTVHRWMYAVIAGIWLVICGLALTDAPAVIHAFALGSLASWGLTRLLTGAAEDTELKILDGLRDFFACATLSGALIGALQLWLGAVTSPSVVETAAGLGVV